MKVRFVGGINGVTGSCTHFMFPRTNAEFLVDCGMSQGEVHSGAENAKPFPFRPRDLKFVLLTHGHLDHCGLIPKLYREGFAGKVLCTAATAGIARAALLDAVPLARLYDRDDVERIVFDRLEERSDFGLSKFIPIDDHLFAGFTRSAHVLGSVSITLSWSPFEGAFRRMVLSGDLGSNTKDNPFQSLLGARQAPFGYPDYMLIESTYGDKVRDVQYADFNARTAALANAIQSAFATGDTLLIPAFSLQRTQELLFDISYVLERNDIFSIGTPIEVVVDSPLARQHTRIFGQELCRRQSHKPDEPLYRNRSLAELLGYRNEREVDALILRIFPETTDDDVIIPLGRHTIHYACQRVNAESGRKIIISGAGMCKGGPVVSYLKGLLLNPRATVLLTGYMAAGTPGALIEKHGACAVEGKASPFEELRIGKTAIRTADIKAKVIEMKAFYSGHADRNGLLDFIFRVPGKRKDEPVVPITIFINHGGISSRTGLRDAIMSHAPGGDERQVHRVEVPEDATRWFDLDAGSWVNKHAIGDVLANLMAEQQRMNDLLERMIAAAEIRTPRKKKAMTKTNDSRLQ